jgi:hypothetical protein
MSNTKKQISLTCAKKKGVFAQLVPIQRETPVVYKQRMQPLMTINDKILYFRQ